MSLSSRWRRLCLALTRAASAFLARALRTRILSRCSFSALRLAFSALRLASSAFLRDLSMFLFSRSSSRRACSLIFRIRSHSLSLARSSLCLARISVITTLFALKAALSSRFFFRAISDLTSRIRSFMRASLICFACFLRACSARAPCISLLMRASLSSFACFFAFRVARSFNSLWLTTVRSSGRNSDLVLFEPIWSYY